jgi:tRNA (guanine37-N1)-methyltransferase
MPQIPGLTNVLPEGDQRRILLLDTVTALPPDVTELIGDVPLVPFTATLIHKNLPLHELLKMQLPEGCVIPSAFETVGHIAHLNLFNKHVPYERVIGEAILLKGPLIKTVVTKVGSIHNVYRSMDLEILAGEPHFETEIQQRGLRFRLDCSKAYWNSRLECEHDSLVESFVGGSVVADAMCGISTFAVRAAKRKGYAVFANYLNPDSYEWLVQNVQLNKVEATVQCFNVDGREFITKIFSEGGCDYLVMNLPATVVEFLGVVGECAKRFRETARLPIVHFHSFDPKDRNHEASLKERAQAALGMNLPDLTVYKVRDVSPVKGMFRCTFSIADLFGDEETSARAIPPNPLNP